MPEAATEAVQRGVRGHAADAAGSLGRAGSAVVGHARHGLDAANERVAGAISEHGSIWGAMKAGASKRPVTAAIIAAATITGAVLVGNHVFGKHTARVEASRAQSGRLER